MSGAHAAPRPPVREHLSRPLLALAALGIAPPVLIVGPQLTDGRAVPAPVSRPDEAPAEPAAVAGGAVERSMTHTDRWGARSVR